MDTGKRETTEMAQAKTKSISKRRKGGIPEKKSSGDTAFAKGKGMANVSPLKEIVRRLDGKGAFGDAHGTVSIRIPGGNDFLFLDTSSAMTGKRSRDYEAMDRSSAPDKDLYDLHAKIYETRGDVGAIMTGCPKWGMSLGQIPGPMPAVFDEQARQLGKSIKHFSDELHEKNPRELFKELSSGSNVVLLSDSVLVCGVTPEKLVFNSELLEKCARAYLYAYLTGQKIRKIPFYVRIIANSRMLKDQKRSAESYARGEVP
ncbi:MAG TPA: hypothetical protein DEA96_16515, partial [Leptospiraceae bacterium]|nr:hypothetical protein [Leptospiraceae bacterium]